LLRPEHHIQLSDSSAPLTFYRFCLSTFDPPPPPPPIHNHHYTRTTASTKLPRPRPPPPPSPPPPPPPHTHSPVTSAATYPPTHFCFYNYGPHPHPHGSFVGTNPTAPSTAQQPRAGSSVRCCPRVGGAPARWTVVQVQRQQCRRYGSASVADFSTTTTSPQTTHPLLLRLMPSAGWQRVEVTVLISLAAVGARVRTSASQEVTRPRRNWTWACAVKHQQRSDPSPRYQAMRFARRRRVRECARV
jgi:hypothetical protein